MEHTTGIINIFDIVKMYKLIQTFVKRTSMPSTVARTNAQLVTVTDKNVFWVDKWVYNSIAGTGINIKYPKTGNKSFHGTLGATEACDKKADPDRIRHALLPRKTTKYHELLSTNV